MENKIAEKPNDIQPVKKEYPNLGQAFGLIGILILIMFSVFIILGLLSSLINYQNKQVINGISYVLSMLAILGIGIGFRRSFKFQLKKVQVPILLLTIPMIICLDIIVEPIINIIPMSDFFRNMFNDYITNDLNTFLMIGIAAPLLEELVFRGIILNGFLKQYSPWKSILWSAAIFGIAHLNPWQFIAAFSIGIVIGWLYWKTNSLLPGILVHFTSNTSSFIMLWFTSDNFVTIQQLMGGGKSYYLLYGMCIPIFLGTLFLISQRIKMKESAL